MEASTRVDGFPRKEAAVYERSALRQAILAFSLISSSVGAFACDNGEKVKKESSTKDAVTIQKAAEEFYKAKQVCPKTAELTLPKEFAARGAADAWGNPFEVVC